MLIDTYQAIIIIGCVLQVPGFKAVEVHVADVIPWVKKGDFCSANSSNAPMMSCPTIISCHDNSKIFSVHILCIPCVENKRPV